MERQASAKDGDGRLAALPPPKVGIAFSGGGIRAAIVGSGVLCEFLERGVETTRDSRFFFSSDLMFSAVSGGGFLATALLDWAIRERAEWMASGEQFRDGFRRFFATMRAHAGFLTWSNVGLQAALIVSWAIVEAFFSMLLIAAPGFVVAEFTVLVVGQRLRAAARGGRVELEFLWALLVTAGISAAVTGTLWISRAFLPAGYMGARLAVKRVTTGLKALLSSTMLWMAIVLLATLLIDSSRSIPFGFDLTTIIALVLVLRLLRAKLRVLSATAIIIYVYARILTVRLDERTAGFGFLSPANYDLCIVAAQIVLILSPFLLPMQQRLVGEGYRYFLEQAFYHPSGQRSFASILLQAALEPFFPAGSCHDALVWPRGRLRPLVMSELGVRDTPELALCMTANRFPADPVLSPGLRDESRTLFAGQHGSFLVLQPPDLPDQEFAAVGPHTVSVPLDFELSRAMCLSGAAISFRAGALEALRSVTAADLFFTGFQLGALIHNSPQPRGRSVGNFVAWVLGQSFFFGIAPLVAYFTRHDWLLYVTLAAYIAVVVLTVWVDPYTKLNDAWRRGVVDYVLQYPSVHFARVVIGPRSHPRDPLLQLSDGGHHENLALIPQFLRRTRLIFSIDCSSDELGICTDLIRALTFARRYLRCQFRHAPRRGQPDQGRDRARHLDDCDDPDLETLLHAQIDHQRHAAAEALQQSDLVIAAHLQVKYAGEREWADLMYLKLVSPKGSPPFAGQPPTAGLCCDCCVPCCSRSRMCSVLSDALVGRFPHHYITAQLLTPRIWSAYHSLGVQAMRHAFLQVNPFGGHELRVPKQGIATCEIGEGEGPACPDGNHLTVFQDAEYEWSGFDWAGLCVFVAALLVPCLSLAALLSAAAPSVSMVFAEDSAGNRYGFIGMRPVLNASQDSQLFWRWNSLTCEPSFCRGCMLPGALATFFGSAAFYLALLLPPLLRWSVATFTRRPPRFFAWHEAVLSGAVASLTALALACWQWCADTISNDLDYGVGWWLAIAVMLICGALSLGALAAAIAGAVALRPQDAHKELDRELSHLGDVVLRSHRSALSRERIALERARTLAISRGAAAELAPPDLARDVSALSAP